MADHKLFEAPLRALHGATADRESARNDPANLLIAHSEAQESGVYPKLVPKNAMEEGSGLARPARARRHGPARAQQEPQTLPLDDHRRIHPGQGPPRRCHPSTKQSVNDQTQHKLGSRARSASLRLRRSPPSRPVGPCSIRSGRAPTSSVAWVVTRQGLREALVRRGMHHLRSSGCAGQDERDEQPEDPYHHQDDAHMGRLTPLIDVVTAHFRIAPIAISTKLAPILISRHFLRLVDASEIPETGSIQTRLPVRWRPRQARWRPPRPDRAGDKDRD